MPGADRVGGIRPGFVHAYSPDPHIDPDRFHLVHVPVINNLLDLDVVVHATDNCNDETKAEPEPEGGGDQAKCDTADDTSTNTDHAIA